MAEVTAEALAAELAALPKGRRTLVGIAGAPGGGKSTLADMLADTLNAGAPGRAAVMGMDGFHFDDRVLEARGDRARKGAPHTFDVGGLAAMLARLRSGKEDVAVPVFDREIEIARAGAAIIPASVDVVLVEGNYLLTDQNGWAALRDAFDLRVMVEVDRDELERRLMARWTGLGMSVDAARAKVADNDLPNGDFVREHSVGIDRVVRDG
ncbi:nucleoside/nucleotide kinase family protein [Pseudaestuariivita atlantica]|uniref:Nucleoside triphosphate hydrolase n=1 Tax=Pseudaestuariivita atlantica TaxID=1317121 RepID=A0A0L1JNX9_9RHOB|nr:nucleoside/nucleotide kinase family protein [Pseudaestuariivita atlantica]KNG93431.1 nucleoside triphosphate hydrolase [Pseudaestuariivita atlantica]